MYVTANRRVRTHARKPAKLVMSSVYWRYVSFLWWRHQMETFSALLAFCVRNSPVTGEFPTQMPVTQSFDVFCDLHKRLNKPPRGWWSETPSCSLWRHCNVIILRIMMNLLISATWNKWHSENIRYYLQSIWFKFKKFYQLLWIWNGFEFLLWTKSVFRSLLFIASAKKPFNGKMKSLGGKDTQFLSVCHIHIYSMKASLKNFINLCLMISMFPL